MASFEDAFSNMIISGLNPMNGIMSQLAQTQVAVAKESVRASEVVSMDKLEARIAEMLARVPAVDPEIIQIYKDRLKTYKVT